MSTGDGKKSLQNSNLNPPADGSSIDDGPEKPKKCVIVRKTRISDNLEKIELRYVAYNKVEKGSKTTTLDVISDASTYLKQRATEIDLEDNKSKRELKIQSEKSENSTDEKEHRKLQLCLPILTSIRVRFEDIEKSENVSQHRKKLCSTLKGLCDEILEEAAYTLENRLYISAELMRKIQNINKLSRQVINNESAKESLVQDEAANTAEKNADKTHAVFICIPGVYDKELAVSKSRTSDKTK